MSLGWLTESSLIPKELGSERFRFADVTCYLSHVNPKGRRGRAVLNNLRPKEIGGVSTSSLQGTQDVAAVCGPGGSAIS